MKKLIILLGVIFITTICAEPLNRVIAVVNGEPITAHQFEVFYNRSLDRLTAEGQSAPNPQQFRQFLLNQYIDRVLQLQLAQRFGVTVTDKQVDQQIKTLAQQQHITADAFVQHTLAQGYTADGFRNEVKTEMIIGLLQRQVLGDRVMVSQAEIKAKIKAMKNAPQLSSQYHVMDFLVLSKLNATSEEIQQAAANHVNGNDLGWRTLSQLPDVFAAALPHLKLNQFSAPIRAPNGYHVLQLLGVKDSSMMPSTQAVGQQIYMMKIQKELAKWLDTIRKQATIQLYGSA